jgi:chemotaxis-related protein WspB
VLVRYQGDAQQTEQVLGLILEQATDTVRCDPTDFKPYGLDNRQAPYLGPVREDAHGLLQWVRVNDLLDESVRGLLFPASPLNLDDLEALP